MKSMDIYQFLSMEDIPLVDVRSPGEYADGHIPGAISLPLFSDKERAIVGTSYKQQSQKAAIREGLNIAGGKMAEFIDAVDNIGANELRLHCWRGGMRSESMAWLCDKLISQTYVLQGGYKAYRHELLAFFDQPLPLTILTGNTGSGKTRVLHALQQQGQQVVDLEKHANHHGSSFGYQKSTGQPTTEHFQNLLFENFRPMDLSQPIWLEDESFCIGKACLPEQLFQQMQQSPRYLLRADIERRIDNILLDYGTMHPEKLIAATRGIRKKLGQGLAEEAEEFISRGALKEAAAILLGYYDKRYKKSLAKSAGKVVATLDVSRENEHNIARSLIEKLYVR